MTPSEIVKYLRSISTTDNALASREAATLIESQQSELNKLTTINRKSCEDWAEDDTHVRNATKPFFTDFEINGDSYGVPCITDIVDLMVKRIESQQENLESLQALYDNKAYGITTAQAMVSLQMKMEIEELRKDKARLDWVQNNSIELASNRCGQWVALSPMFPEPSSLLGKGFSIRQAIDAAMKPTTP